MGPITFLESILHFEEMLMLDIENSMFWVQIDAACLLQERHCYERSESQSVPSLMAQWIEHTPTQLVGWIRFPVGYIPKIWKTVQPSLGVNGVYREKDYTRCCRSLTTISTLYKCRYICVAPVQASWYRRRRHLATLQVVQLYKARIMKLKDKVFCQKVHF